MTLRGKARRSPAAGVFVEAGQSLSVEALSPLAHDLPRRVETSGNDIICKALAGKQDDLRPDNVAIW
jgi:hypothetical protein